MLIYNVTVKVETQAQDEWLEWMRQEHIPAVMRSGKFEDYRICRLLHQEEDGVTYAVQYFCRDLAAMYAYQQEDAPRLQAEHASRFSGKYVAFRTLMEIL